MQNENISRVAGLLNEEGLDWAILTGFDSVCFATGHITGIESGASPFSGGPTLAIIGRDGSAGVVASNIEGAQAEHVEYALYSGFANAITDQEANYVEAISTLFARLRVSGAFGVENSLPQLVADQLGARRTNISTPLTRLRAIKTEAEVEKLRWSGKIAAAGQKRAREVSVPGETELGALNAIRSTMEVMANSRCALVGEYITSVERTVELGLPVNATAIAKGDPIVCDLAPRVDGYWGDSCASFVPGGTASDEYVRMWEAARSALKLAETELRPGLRVCDFDAMVRGRMQEAGYDYPHHSGHGVGASVHEWPRLVSDETALIEQNMVLMVEPGSYVPGVGGLRCEFMFLVTANGCENLTEFTQDWRL